MKKKKILMVCEAFGGGVFAYVTQLCNDMCNEFDIYLAYSLRPQTPSDFQNKLDNSVHLIPMHAFSDKSNSILKIYNIIKELRSIERKINPDIIHLHSSIAGGFGRIAYHNLKKNIVYTPHGYAFILMGDGIKSKLYYYAEKFLGKIKNTLILTCCESEDAISKKLCRKTYYIETGLNIKSLDAQLKDIKKEEQPCFTVFTLGRACIQKQPQLFNEIAKLLPNVRFLWVGGGELENCLTADNIEVTGWKTREEALALAKGADAFILCSKGEAIAMSLIENMYLKKLCLVSNTVGNKSVISDGVNGFICNEAIEYANRIQEAMANFPYKIVENAYEDIRNVYNTNTMKDKFIKFYNRIAV
ncbi:glycosyltransferase [Selenomonas ruminantium]|uniref:glycosyltransferase n=1 Tax=Selenomonas ruminantium TaxID=971 RepID=UPI0026F177BB|nr:glycosyltransferase [Selenomonas ruminantium]